LLQNKILLFNVIYKFPKAILYILNVQNISTFQNVSLLKIKGKKKAFEYFIYYLAAQTLVF